MTVYNQNISFYKGETKLFPITVIDEDTGGAKNLSGASIVWEVLNRYTGEVIITKTTSSGISINAPASGIFTVVLEAVDTNLLQNANWYYHKATVSDISNAISVVTVGNITLDGVRVSNLGLLIPQLRIILGDTEPSTFRYLDVWLHEALIAGVKFLGSWWDNKYLLDGNNNAYRNTEIFFDDTEPPVVTPQDEMPIVLASALITLEGGLQNASWDIVSWRDAEISFSNLESGRLKDKSIERLWNQLTAIITPPGKTLAGSRKMHLPGYKHNQIEY
jgi:hypothetical protein